MKLKVNPEIKDAEALLPPAQPDNSGIGVNYTDAYIKALNTQLENGQALSCKRKGLKITLGLGDKKGEALMRRREFGPDPRAILRQALTEAAQNIGARLLIEDGVLFL